MMRIEMPCKRAFWIGCTVPRVRDATFGHIQRLYGKSFHANWWSKQNVADFVSKTLFDNYRFEDFGHTLDDHRAFLVSRRIIPRYYVNEPRIKTWLAERWSAWENDPPPWFDDDFKRSLPACILPEGVHVPKPMSSAAKLARCDCSRRQ